MSTNKNNDRWNDLWAKLEKGFMPYQTMPGYTAHMQGDRATGIALITFNDYPAFGEGNGVKIRLVPPEDCYKVLPIVEECEREFDLDFNAFMKWAKPVKTFYESVVIKDTIVSVGDFCMLTSTVEGSQETYTVTELVRACSILDRDVFIDDEGVPVPRNVNVKSFSLENVSERISLKELPDASILENYRPKHRVYGRKDSSFMKFEHPDSIVLHEVLLDNAPTGYLLARMSGRGENGPVEDTLLLMKSSLPTCNP